VQVDQRSDIGILSRKMAAEKVSGVDLQGRARSHYTYLISDVCDVLVMEIV
jgi:hypothetical protein